MIEIEKYGEEENVVAKNMLLGRTCDTCRYNVSWNWCELNGTQIPKIEICKVWRNHYGEGYNT